MEPPARPRALDPRSASRPSESLWRSRRSLQSQIATARGCWRRKWSDSGGPTLPWRKSSGNGQRLAIRFPCGTGRASGKTVSGLGQAVASRRSFAKTCSNSSRRSGARSLAALGRFRSKRRFRQLRSWTSVGSFKRSAMRSTKPPAPCPHRHRTRASSPRCGISFRCCNVKSRARSHRHCPGQPRRRPRPRLPARRSPSCAQR
mmetsp:Transcript_27532/g.65406  ORF Transcript_27532/g.65406 Transcript_27532/m.65406 type:complete len:203 (-) Transcript_27532:620-1228(-)